MFVVTGKTRDKKRGARPYREAGGKWWKKLTIKCKVIAKCDCVSGGLTKPKTISKKQKKVVDFCFEGVVL